MIEQLKHWSAMARLTSTKESVLSADQLDEIAAYIDALQQKFYFKENLTSQVVELQQKLDAMAAESAALKESVEHAAGCIHAAEVEGLQDALESHDGERLADLVHRRLCHAYLPVETPATDAYLNSVRAEGVQMVAEAIGNSAAKLKAGSKDWKSLKSIVFTLVNFAAQLRSGTHDTADKAG